MIRRQTILFVLLILGCMFAYNDEPKLKKHHWKLFWIEKEVKSIVKIDFIDETNIFDSLMTISYGYQLPIPGLVSAYINFTDFHKTQYHLSDIEKVENYNQLSAQELSKTFSVRYIVQGTLWKMNDIFQLTIEFYDSKDDKILWSDSSA